MFNDGAELEFVLQDVRPSDALVAAGVLEDEPQSDDDAVKSRHLLVYCEPTDEKLFEHDWTALRHELDSVNINLLPDGVLPRLAVTVASGVGIDLLQGQYGEKTDIGAIFRPWRLAAMLLVAVGVLGLAGKAVDYVRLSAEARIGTVLETSRTANTMPVLTVSLWVAVTSAAWWTRTR